MSVNLGGPIISQLTIEPTAYDLFDDNLLTQNKHNVSNYNLSKLLNQSF